ncbi:hypothetical protein N9L68_05455 [bacterium]|nr:hypothetical protein [bacterium]
MVGIVDAFLGSRATVVEAGVAPEGLFDTPSKGVADVRATQVPSKGCVGDGPRLPLVAQPGERPLRPPTEVVEKS